MGRYPKFVPNDEQRRQVMMLAGFGFTHDRIASFIGISDVILRRCFRKELDDGPTEANLRVANALYKNATTNGNVTAQIFWMRSRMGWKDRNVDELDEAPTAVDFSWQPALPSPTPATPAADTIEGDGIEVTWDVGEC